MTAASCRPAVLALVLVLAGCAVGPSYQAPTPAPAGARLGAAGPADTLTTFFDSLAARRGAGEPLAGEGSLAVLADTAGDLQWLGLLRDTTLVELVRGAVRDNRSVALASARVREYRALAGAARGPLLPQLSANGSLAHQQSVFGSLGTFQFDAFRVTADLSWELDLWGRIRRGVSAANLDRDQQDANLRATLLALVSEVATAYLELRELDANRAIAERTLGSRQVTLRLAQQRFDQGLTSEIDVRQFEAQVAGPAASAADFRRLVAEKEHQLSVLLGRPPATIPRGAPLEEVVRAVSVPDSVPSVLVARRPDVQAAERAYAAANARIGVAVGARLPRILLTGQYGSQAEQLDNLFRGNTEVYTAQAGISVPLFTGGQLRNQEAAARARSEQARVQYEQTVLVALREVSDALVGVRATRDQFEAQRLQAEALRRALALADQRYRGGVSSYLEVLDAQRSLFTAELLLTQVQRQYLVSAVRLYKALGGSWEG